MIIKIIINIFLGMFFLSCGTKTVVPEPAVLPSNKNVDNKKQPMTSSSNIVENPVPQDIPVITAKSDVSYEFLNKAIATGINENIKEASIEILYLYPKDIRALNALAMYYYGRQQIGAAELLLNKAMAINPNISGLYNNMGLIELAKGNERAALDRFRKAIELDQQNGPASSNAAAIYIKQKDYQKALYSLEKLSTKDKEKFNSLNNFAIALSAVGKDKEAAEVYADLIEESPGHKAAMLNYAILMINKQQKYKDGLDLINRLKFIGIENESREVIKDLEIKAKAGLK